MNEFILINAMNEAMINTLKEKNKNCDINLSIKEYLKDEAIFFKIDREKAFSILKNVGVMEEQLENVYQKLISENIFYDLLNKGKINIDNDKLYVKYDTASYKNLFSKK